MRNKISGSKRSRQGRALALPPGPTRRRAAVPPWRSAVHKMVLRSGVSLLTTSATTILSIEGSRSAMLLVASVTGFLGYTCLLVGLVMLVVTRARATSSVRRAKPRASRGLAARVSNEKSQGAVSLGGRGQGTAGASVEPEQCAA
jgi:hypothetical protein